MSISDDLMGALDPYKGGESYPPYFGIRVGRITNVYASQADVTANDNQDQFVGSVQVQWLDQSSPSDQLIPWAFPVFSNPLISTTEADTTDTPSNPTTQNSVGSSFGIFFVPSVGDLAVCAFRNPSTPVVLGYVPHNYNKQQLSLADKTAQGLLSFGPFRTLKQGEFAFRSQQQAEIYMDRAGAIQISVLDQPEGDGTPPIDTTVVPTDELLHINLGVTYDDAFENPNQSDEGENLIFDMTLSNGSRVQIDAAGNMDIVASGKLNLTVEDDANVSIQGNVNIVGAKNVVVQAAQHVQVGGQTQVSIGSGGPLGLGGLTALMSAVNGMTFGVGANTTVNMTPSEMDLVANAMKLNNGSKGAARQDDATISNTSLDSTFWTFMSNLFTIFNAHVHTSAAPGNPTSPPITPLTPSAPTSLTGKINAGSSTVQIG